MSWFRVPPSTLKEFFGRHKKSVAVKTRGPSPREIYKERMDGIWSFVVRRRHIVLHGKKCRICSVRPIEVGYHIVPKQTGDAVRWLIENGCGACAPCNFGEHKNRSLYRKKHVRLFGREFVEKIEDKAGPLELTDDQLQDIMRWLVDMAQGLPDAEIPEAPACLRRSKA